MTRTEIYHQLIKTGCSDQYAEYEATKHGTGELDKSPQVKIADKTPEKRGVLSKLKEAIKNGNA